MKSLSIFLKEAIPERAKSQNGPKPFKDPLDPLQTGPRRVRRKSSAGPGTTAQPESGSPRTTRKRTSALRPEYFDADGNLRPEAARRFADRRAGAGYSRAGETLTPERKASLDKVNDLFKRFDAGDADAASEVKSIRDRIIQKHGAANKHPSFKQVNTGTSPAPSPDITQQLRDLQGKRGQTPLDPALQQAVSDRLSGSSTSQVVDNPGRPAQSAMDKTRANVDARRAGATSAGTPTPKPGIRVDTLGDAIRNVPQEPELPKVTGGQPRTTDRTGMSQSEFRRLVQNKKSTTIPKPTTTKPTTIGSPTASGITPQRAAAIAASRNATPQGVMTTASKLKSFGDFMQNSKLGKVAGVAGRGTQVLGVGLDGYQGYSDAQQRGSSRIRSIGRGVTRALGGLVGGTLGATGGASVGTLGGAITGPGAVVTGFAGGLAGGIAGQQYGSDIADKAFQTVAGATSAEKQLMRKRKRESQIDSSGKGPVYSYASGNKAIVKDPTTGKARVGYLSYKDNKPVYTAPNTTNTLRYTSSNPLERVGRTIAQTNKSSLGNWLSNYYSKKDETNRLININKQAGNI